MNQQLTVVKTSLIELPVWDGKYLNEWHGCFSIPMKGPRAGKYLFEEQTSHWIEQQESLILDPADFTTPWIREYLEKALDENKSILINDPWHPRPGVFSNTAFRVLHDVRTESAKARFEFYLSVEHTWY